MSRFLKLLAIALDDKYSVEVQQHSLLLDGTDMVYEDKGKFHFYDWDLDTEFSLAIPDGMCAFKKARYAADWILK